MTIADLVRDLRCQRRAIADYSDRATALFEREDRERTAGNDTNARNIHIAAIIAGHAAWAEINDPEVA